MNNVHATAEELQSIVDIYAGKFATFSESEFNARPRPDKWSRKEVLGHLIDSAQNNLRRFIVGQYESHRHPIVYDQDYWVKANNYQEMPGAELTALWRLMNSRIVAVLRSMPESNYQKLVLTSELHTLEFLAVDYVKHLKHHLNQIIAGSFDVIYP